MNSMNGQSGDVNQMEVSHFQKMQPVDFDLTYEQYLIIQHVLPKKYALIQHKNIKKGGVVPSAVKLGPEDVVGIVNQTQNISRFSGNVENTQEIEGRTKRMRIKKVDKFLEQQPLKARKSTVSGMSVEDEFAQCSYILNQLKKQKCAIPFLEPVDPQRDRVYNYFDIIKQPMDLSTVQANLNNGLYRTPAEFHAHMNKIWTNSYTFNQKSSLVHKYTVDTQKYYKSLLNSENFKKGSKGEKTKARVEKEKIKVQAGQQRDQSKKTDYWKKQDNFLSKDFVNDQYQ